MHVRDACSTYITNELTKHRTYNRESDVADFKFDIRLSILKPMHARAITASYEYFKTQCGIKLILSGWQAARLTGAVKRYRDNGIDSLMLVDPFSRLTID